MKRVFVLLVAICAIILCVSLVLKQPSSNSPVSVKEFIESRNGELGIDHIIALTEVSNKFDLVFYTTSNDHIAANILIKNEDGNYVGFVMTTTKPLNKVNDISASSRQSYLSENTLYWGIARSPEWTIDHPNSHQIVIDDLVLGYYLHDKSLDEEILDLKFVCNVE